MSTIGLDSWAVDLKDVGAIYPFQGTEVAMAIIAIVLWIAWHIWQLRSEDAGFREKMRQLDSAKAKSAIDRY
jgi:hypothetical protein